MRQLSRFFNIVLTASLSWTAACAELLIVEDASVPADALDGEDVADASGASDAELVVDASGGAVDSGCAILVNSLRRYVGRAGDTTYQPERMVVSEVRQYDEASRTLEVVPWTQERFRTVCVDGDPTRMTVLLSYSFAVEFKGQAFSLVHSYAADVPDTADAPFIYFWNLFAASTPPLSDSTLFAIRNQARGSLQFFAASDLSPRPEVGGTTLGPASLHYDAPVLPRDGDIVDLFAFEQKLGPLGTILEVARAGGAQVDMTRTASEARADFGVVVAPPTVGLGSRFADPSHLRAQSIRAASVATSTAYSVSVGGSSTPGPLRSVSLFSWTVSRGGPIADLVGTRVPFFGPTPLLTQVSVTAVSFNRTFSAWQRADQTSTASVVALRAPVDVTIDGVSVGEVRPLQNLTPVIAWRTPVETAARNQAFRVQVFDGSTNRQVIDMVTRQDFVVVPPGALRPGQLYGFVLMATETPIAGPTEFDDTFAFTEARAVYVSEVFATE